MLDHHYVEDEQGYIYVVYGNHHPPGRIHAYVKYIPATRTTPWCRSDKCYERVVKHYAISEILGRHQSLEYEPAYGVPVPMLRLRGREKIHDPRPRLRSMLSKPRDRLEEGVALLVDGLRGAVPPGSLGITGSMLVGIHNPSLSDVDITVYGCRDTLRLVEHVRETGMLATLPPGKLREWASRVASIHGMELRQALSMYRPWRRGVYGDMVVSIIPVDMRIRRYGELFYRGVECIEARVSIAGMQCSALYTPGEVRVENADVVKGSPRLKPSILISFNTVYAPLLYEGGVLMVSGEAAIGYGGVSLLIGTRRCGGFVHRL